MGKKKKKSRNRGGYEDDEMQAPTSNPGGPTRVLLLRHGQSLAQENKDKGIIDAPLSMVGCLQASAWKGTIEHLAPVEVVLISPLTRAVQTALLAYEGVDVPMEMCRHARELWWDEGQNSMGTVDDMKALLCELPQGDQVVRVDEAFNDLELTEDASIAHLQEVLRGRLEDVVAIVCHWGVISALCQESANNAMVLECTRLQASGYLQVEKRHNAPNAPSTL